MLSLFALVVILLDVVDKDDPHKTKIIVATTLSGSILALTIPIADHAKVDREVRSAAEVEVNLATVRRIEAVASALGEDHFLRVNVDGSITVVDAAEMEREHIIKLMRSRVAAYREFMSATGPRLQSKDVAKIVAQINANELLGVHANPETGHGPAEPDGASHGLTEGSDRQPAETDTVVGAR